MKKKTRHMSVTCIVLLRVSGYGCHMRGTGAERAAAIVDEGFPIDLAPHAVEEHIVRSVAALGELEGEVSLRTVKLLTGVVVAEQHRNPVHAATRYLELTDLVARMGGKLAEAHRLYAWTVTHPTPEHTEERLRVIPQVLEVARDHGDVDLESAAYLEYLVALLESGNISSLDAELIVRRSAVIDEVWQGRVSPAMWFYCLRSILDGDTELAEEQAEAIIAAQIRDEETDEYRTEALAQYITQMGMIRWMQGRVDGAEAMFLRARRAYPEQLLWPASLAWLWILQGRRSAGEQLLSQLPSIAEIPRDRYWLSTMTVLAEIATVHGPKERAQELRQLLLPFADRLISVGSGVAFWGTVARTLALLEERLGMIEAACEHFTLAVETSGRIGALAWQTEAQIELATFALRHDITSVPVYDMLAEAKATSVARGFHALAHRAMAQPRIRVLGHFEVVSTGGVRAEWNSRKARELLKMLIAQRGIPTSREVFMDVLWPGESPAKLGNRFSVAVNVIRRAFDPDKQQPTQYFLVTEGDAVRLELANLDIDLERFLTLAKRGDDVSLEAARQLYRGDAFSEEPYADWAVTIRDHTRHVWQSLQLAGAPVLDTTL